MSPRRAALIPSLEANTSSLVRLVDSRKSADSPYMTDYYSAPSLATRQRFITALAFLIGGLMPIYFLIGGTNPLVPVLPIVSALFAIRKVAVRQYIIDNEGLRLEGISKRFDFATITSYELKRLSLPFSLGCLLMRLPQETIVVSLVSTKNPRAFVWVTDNEEFLAHLDGAFAAWKAKTARRTLDVSA
jgi:hypothetical protein